MTFLSMFFKQRKRDIEEEIQSHLRMAIQERVNRGEPIEQAREAALHEFGNVPLVQDVTREMWGWIWLDHFWQDVRYAVRQLRKSPAFTIAVVATLGLGLGTTTAIFSVVNGVLLQPLPYPHPDHLVAISSRFEGGPDFRVSRAAQFRFLQQHSRSLESLSAYDGVLSGVNLSGEGDPEQVPGAFVSADFFRVLGVAPALGRVFRPGEDQPGAACVAVIANNLFRVRYKSNPSIVDKEITINGQNCLVAGVLPPGFQFYFDAEMFLPVRIAPVPTDLGHYYGLLGRLKPGVTVEQERTELLALFSQFKVAHRNLVDDGEVGFEADPYREIVLGNVGTALWVLLAAVFVLLLIACVNVAHLLISRASVRSKEMAVRAALGARPLRLIRQLIVESALLAFAGGAFGLVLCFFGVPVLLHFAPGGIPRVKDISVNFGVVAFAFVLSCLTAVIFGVMPAVAVLRVDVNAALKATRQRGAAGAATGMARGFLIGTEVALSIVLLTGAILLARSFLGLHRVDPGFDPKNVLAFKMTLPPKYWTTSRMWEFESAVLARLDALPGVDMAASATSLPMEAGPDMPGVVLGQPRPRTINPAYRPVSPNYFHVLGIPLLQGRSFTDADTANSLPVAILSNTLARRAFQGRNPIGQRLQLGAGLGAEYSDQPRVIVGVAGDVRETSLTAPADATVFIPRAQIPEALSPLMNRVLPMSWAVRTRIPPKQLIGSIRRAVIAVDSQQPIANLRTMDEALSNTLDRQRFTLLMMAIFASLAMLLASVGIYGVVSYQVRQRERELGIRLALGAVPGSLVRTVTVRGIRPVAAGILVGSAASLALAKLIRSLLFETSPNDPISLAASACFFAVVTFLGVYLPARRASSFVDPMQMLRDE